MNTASAVLRQEDLIAWTQLKPLAPGTWLAQGVDPQFRVACRMPAGWYRIRFALACDFQTRVEIFADTGAGLDVAECIERMNLRGHVTRDFVVNIPRPVFGFRFDPVDTPGQFRLGDLCIQPVSRAFVLRKALWSATRKGTLLQTLSHNLRLLACGRLGQVKRVLLENLSGPNVLAPPPNDAAQAYAAWRRRRQLTATDHAQMRQTIAALRKTPLISFLMLAARASPDDLRHTLSSLREQLYPHWEVCVGVPPSEVAGTRRVLAGHAESHITVIGVREGDWNALLDLAAGDFIALADPGDRLAEHALFTMALRISHAETPDMIYSDEDFATAGGTEPFFKPDWSPEYLLSFPYTGRLAFYRTVLVRELGGFREELGAAQEYDLVLRASAAAQKIVHVADVLYHGSPKRERGARPAASLAGALGSLRDHVRATGRPASIEPGPKPGLHRVRFAIGRPRVSIIIPTAYRKRPADDETFLARCLESIRSKSTYTNYHITVLDNNGVPSDLASVLSRQGIRRESYALPFNWAAAMNQGAALVDGEHLLILDDDTEVITPDWIECLLEYSQQPEIGVVGARLHFPDERLQHSGVTVLDGVPGHPFYRGAPEDTGYFYSSTVPRNWSAVTGACLMTRAAVFRAVGGFDENFGVNFNDIDYCLRVARTGRRIVCTPFARLYHHETATKAAFLPGELEAFRKRWRDHWREDPCYNPNLSKRFHDFRVEV